MIDKAALAAGLAGEKISRKLTGTRKVCPKRSAVATGAGAGLGYLAGKGAVIGLRAIGSTVAAPVVVPIAVAAGGIAFIRSLF